MITIRESLKLARTMLASSQSADLDAQALLIHVLQVERAYLFAHGDHVLDGIETRVYQSMLERRAAGEPVAYIIGAKGFYDLELAVSSAVLIPRPETELLLEEALRLTAPLRRAVVADIGTGSGALAIALERHRPQCAVYATDISADALAVARQNAEDHDADVTFFRGNLALPLIDHGVKVDLLMANLPYIATKDLNTLQAGQWEPRLALDGGADGLNLIRQLLSQLPFICRPGAQVLLEVGAEQGQAVCQLVRERLNSDATVKPDYAGLDRIIYFAVG
ncbi:MAG: peptide chain release factor N(5)-glutamine methyltransferase [Chloroflexi bacterium]|nr:peptide chain release factor N(5)-glutamine methyltransferase [Chloroflexota bacterium]